MKLTRPSGVTACLGRGEQEEQDLRNNRLRPEKFPWKSFRTGVQLPPPPPKKKDTTYVVSFFFGFRRPKGRRNPSVIKMLGVGKAAPAQFFAALRIYAALGGAAQKGRVSCATGEFRLCQGFWLWPKTLVRRKRAAPLCGAPGSAAQRRLRLAYFWPKRPNVNLRCLKQRGFFPYN